MKPARSKTYPTWGDLVAIIGIYVAASLCFGWLALPLGQLEIIPQGCVQMIVYVLTFVSTISYALWVRWLRTGHRGEREPLFTGWKLDLTWIFFGMIALFCRDDSDRTWWWLSSPSGGSNCSTNTCGSADG